MAGAPGGYRRQFLTIVSIIIVRVRAAPHDGERQRRNDESYTAAGKEEGCYMTRVMMSNVSGVPAAVGEHELVQGSAAVQARDHAKF